MCGYVVIFMSSTNLKLTSLIDPLPPLKKNPTPLFWNLWEIDVATILKMFVYTSAITTILHVINPRNTFDNYLANIANTLEFN